MILSFGPAGGWALAAGTALVYAVPAVAGTRMAAATVQRVLLVAWLLHALTLAAALLGTAPRFGFAPALSGTAWLVLAVYGIERQVFPQLRTGWLLAMLGAAAVLLAALFPGTVLHESKSPWLPLHWLLGIASYGLFAAAVVHAWLMRRAEKSMRRADGEDGGIPLLTLERLTFRFVGAGFVLLSATLLAGVLFSESLYGAGQVWRWDHKTIFSVLSWLAFAVLLLGRARFGWRGRKAVRVLYAGSVLLLLAYVGSRFVLEVFLGRGT
ncbi:MAG TPA: cytochrome c biogenesis protein CcsA [Burkholderiaceae bacterium]